MGEPSISRVSNNSEGEDSYIDFEDESELRRTNSSEVTDYAIETASVRRMNSNSSEGEPALRRSNSNSVLNYTSNTTDNDEEEEGAVEQNDGRTAPADQSYPDVPDPKRARQLPRRVNFDIPNSTSQRPALGGFDQNVNLSDKTRNNLSAVLILAIILLVLYMMDCVGIDVKYFLTTVLVAAVIYVLVNP